ncbi:xanthine dehydrogenase family protein molybdopterin-binding subunit [Mesorhizobium sp. CGMCC 1.15528]|uniref:Xanthine dehydrogenase family protein molybdopterin-binding subunit n=1 Tax=Mesorhizobium zhangyense TaxID=1776730 RepID=A0A7C9VIN0_9HYPH|nr:xanthine dehydrogenase family protein molybdopterin-binding subunit [Mesorhizobium zhangyense]
MTAILSHGISRRAFLTASAALGGGLLLGFPLSGQAASQGVASDLNAFIRVGADNTVTLVLPYVEMGQGAYTSQVQLLAEELELDPARVLYEAAPPDEGRYASPLFGGQITGGSGSLRGAWRTLRAAGAAAREMLVTAAAQRWSVSSESCRVENGQIIHASGRTLTYGEVAAEAALLPVPDAPVVKQRSNYRVVGQSLRRLDTPAKIDGTAKFGIDARPPGVQYAVVASCPVLGGKMKSVDTSAALMMPGVKQVVRLERAVAVVATNTWAAWKGLEVLNMEWDAGANASLTTQQMVDAADAALGRSGIVSTVVGDVDQTEMTATDRYEAVVRLPLLAHAAMEPLNCTVDLRPDRCEVWVGSQVVGRAQKAAADAAGLPLERVAIHNLFLGGGFGRRLETDYVTQAVQVARHVSGPVKVTWSREEDIRQEVFRYHNHSRVTVALGDGGAPASWRHKVVGPNIMSRFLPVYQKDGVDLDVVNAASGPYDIPNILIEYSRNEAPEGLHTGNWRGVGPTRNVFIVESVVDDLAHRAGRDPVEYRRAMMNSADTARPRAALELAVQHAGWDETLPARHGRGAAVFSGFDSHVGMVAEVAVDINGRVSVQKVICAIDAGYVVNPDIVRAQIEGGIIFGLSAVLYGQVTIAGGQVEQSNFDTYPVLRMREAPRIEVHIIDSDEEPGGVGEPGTAGAIAAVANAVFAATGFRALTLPLNPSDLRGV